MGFAPGIEMNINRKKLIVTALLALSVLIGTAVIIKIVVSFAVSEKQLKKSVTVFFKENFDKAIEFEDIKLTVFGNVVISNLNISTSSDFNDNISLIKSKRTVIGLDFLDLARKRLLVRDIVFKDAEITIVKKYGESYTDFIKSIFLSGKPLNEIRYIDFNDFRLKLSHARMVYLEGYRDGKIAVECRNFRSLISFRHNRITYEAKGTLIPEKNNGLSRGSIRADGSVDIENLSRAVFSRNRLQMDNLDLSYFNAFLKEHAAQPLSVKGGISVNMAVNTYHDNASATGTISLGNFNLESVNNGSSNTIFFNENLDIDLIADVTDHQRRITFKKFDIDDGNIRLTAGGTYFDNGDENYLDAVFRTEKINLSQVSDYISPWKDVTYSGTLNAAGRCQYDFRHFRAGSISLALNLSDLSVMQKSGGKKESLVDGVDLSVVVRDSAVELRFSARKGPSDLALRCRSFINQWYPLKSTSDINISSGEMSAEIIGTAFVRGIDELLGAAYEDKARGYDPVFFNQKPAGLFASVNNINLRMQIQKISLNGKPGFKDLVLDARLNDGYLKLHNFSLSGYDGDYGLELTGFFNSESPGISTKGKFHNINMEKLARDLGSPGEVKGNLAIDVDYEVNGYRPSHFIENAKANLVVAIDSGYLNRSALQGRLQQFITGGGFGKIAINDLTLNRAGLALHQQGENFFIDGITVQSDRLNLNAYGTYSYYDGLKIPVNVSMNTEPEGDQAPKTINVPAMVWGHLLGPSLRIASGKKTTDLLLFHFN